MDNWVGNPNPYTPLAPTGYPDGSDLPAATITTECGSLYTDNGPGNEGVLFTITVEETVTKVCVTGNAIRGNVVLENASEATLAPAKVCISEGCKSCFPCDHPKYAEWAAVDKPECWCYRYQCYGDADGKENGNILVGKSRVREEDLNKLVEGWKEEGYVGPGTHPWIWADFDRKLNGNILVGFARIREEDLNILVTNWKDDVNINMANPGCGGDIDLTK